MYHALIHYKHRLRGKLKKHIKHAHNMQKVTCYQNDGWRDMLPALLCVLLASFWCFSFYQL